MYPQYIPFSMIYTITYMSLPKRTSISADLYIGQCLRYESLLLSEIGVVQFWLMYMKLSCCKITKTGSVRKIDIEARSFNHCCSGKKLHVLSMCLLPYIFCMNFVCTVLYCHLRPPWLYHIFRHYPINGMIFGNNLLNQTLF